jgi:hypothetical protein
MKRKILERGAFTSRILAAFAAACFLPLLLAPALEAKERRGSEIVVTKLDGTVVAGELLEVRGADLLVLDSSARTGVTLSLTEAASVKVVKRNRMLVIMGAAILGGAAGGGVGWAAQDKWPGVISGTKIAAGAVVGGAAGGIVAAILTSGKKVRIDRSDPESVSQAAAQLRLLARNGG